MKTLLLSLLLVPTLLLGQDKKATVACEGPFNRMEASGGYTIYIRQGSPSKLEVVAEGNAMDNLEYQIKDNTLRISRKSNTKWNKEKITLFVTIENPEDLRISGACEVRGKNTLTGERLQLELSGATDVKLELDVQNLKVGLSGASEAELWGTANTTTIQASGASEFNGKKLAMVRGSADVSGASEVNFAPREELRVRASGASEVTCYSSPASKEVSLSGASELNYKSN